MILKEQGSESTLHMGSGVYRSITGAVDQAGSHALGQTTPKSINAPVTSMAGGDAHPADRVGILHGRFDATEYSPDYPIISGDVDPRRGVDTRFGGRIRHEVQRSTVNPGILFVLTL
ncbi:hypothetical protein N7451_001498 [Penicillium sp. IBT 35674x]|nr:hypothetical protein N7451_001498 [Penicillium sp. IBT 35674x]